MLHSRKTNECSLPEAEFRRNLVATDAIADFDPGPAPHRKHAARIAELLHVRIYQMRRHHSEILQLHTKGLRFEQQLRIVVVLGYDCYYNNLCACAAWNRRRR